MIKRFLVSFAVCCLSIGMFSSSTFAATKTITYKKTGSIEFVPKQKNYFFNTKCKGGPNQKANLEKWNKSKKKWDTIQNQSGQISCSKNSYKETYGGFGVNKGHKYRVYFKNPANSKVTIKAEHGNGTQG